jgi:hypothetical protein
MNAIIGYSEMLMEEAEELGGSALVPDLREIHAAGHHLLTLINDILDLSKIEAGRMELYLEDFDVAPVIEGVATTIQPLAAKNSNVLEVHCAEDTGRMHGDVTKVRQLLFNLLSNACKFTTHGRVSLVVSRQRAGEGDMLQFRIADTGIGMTPEQIERLFQPFTQADSSTTRQYGGTGLGLSITQRFCEMMGGEIAVTSEPGAGTSFTVLLPAKVAEGVLLPGTPAGGSASAAAVDSNVPGGMCSPSAAAMPLVLVIDDDSNVRDLMQRFLLKEGYQVVSAADGEAGLRLARELHPGLITLDVMMPRLDGWSVLGALKADKDLASIPVVMLSVVDDRNLGFALGAADYMTKPVDPERLAEILRKHRRARSSRVLVVEDDSSVRETFQRLLSKDGWGVSEAANGRVALELIEQERPDLILLDLMMPEMNGFEFVEQLRGRPEYRAIPVVVVTAKDVTEEDRQRLNGYVSRILQKGAGTREEMLSEVRNLVAACVPNHV